MTVSMKKLKCWKIRLSKSLRKIAKWLENCKSSIWIKVPKIKKEKGLKFDKYNTERISKGDSFLCFLY